MKKLYSRNTHSNERRNGFLTGVLLSVLIFSAGAALPAYSQGLEALIVEKYYVADATDAADTDGGSLAVGSVTYRIFVDMLPGYSFLVAYGNSNHELFFRTTTSFFNNNDRGADKAELIGATRVDDNTVALDSWLGVGGASAGHLGVLKTEDSDGSILGLDELLKNNDPFAGIPLTTSDGIISGTPGSTTVIGIDANAWFGLDAGNTGPYLSTSNGSWASLGGTQGATSENRVLIAQITTDGIFSFELNLVIGTPQGNGERYVARDANVTANEIYFPSLVNTFSRDIIPPEVSLTSPANNAVLALGQVVTFTADATDPDGAVDSVEFVLNGVKIGTDQSSPYEFNWTAASEGFYDLLAVATDDQGARTVSNPRTFEITLVSNIPPAVSITSPSGGSIFTTGEIISIEASASDTDGQVDSVEFFVNTEKIGSDLSSPYSIEWTAVEGSASITAKATDDGGAVSTSTAVNITVSEAVNIPPTVSITFPLNNSSFTSGQVINITADAFDTDGTVDSVEFLIDDVKVGSDVSSPYSFSWTASEGSPGIKARATDDDGAVTESSAVSITVTPSSAGLPERLQGIRIHPNPATDIIFVELAAAGPENYISYTLINVLGNKVLSGNAGLHDGGYQLAIDISSFAPGLYYLRMVSGNESITRVIVKK